MAIADVWVKTAQMATMTNWGRTQRIEALFRGFAAVLVASAAFAVSSPSAHAESALTPGASVRALAMGGAVRGTASAGAAPVNPAGAVLEKSYQIEGNYGFRPGSDATMLGATAVDSTGRIGMGLYYNFGKSELGASDVTSHEIGAATALPLGPKFALGITPKYRRVKVETPGQAAQSQTDYNIDIGGAFAVADMLTLGVVGYNLADHSVAQPRALGFGAAVGIAQLAIVTADVVIDFTSLEDAGGKAGRKTRLALGSELNLGGRYAVRAGTIYDPSDDDNYVTFGAGAKTERISLDFAYQRQVAGGDESVGLVALTVLIAAPNAAGANDAGIGQE